MRCSTLLCAPLFLQGQNENSTHAVLGRGNESPSGGAAPHDIEVSAHAPPVAGTTGAPQDLNHVTMADAEYFSFLLERMVRVSTTEPRLWRCRAVATFFYFSLMSTCLLQNHVKIASSSWLDTVFGLHGATIPSLLLQQ